MNRLLLILLCISLCGYTFSQTVTDRVYIKGGQAAYGEFLNTIYLYPQFKPGIILYKNGQRYYKPLNYNRINATIEFIEKNDTLILADENAVNTVIVDNDVFFFTPACLRTIHNGKVKLYKYEKMKVGDVQKIGAFGIPNTSTAIETVQQIDTYQRSYNVDVNETIIISRATTYLIETPNNQFVPASKKNFLKSYKKNDDKIEEFTKSNNINFNKEDDLLALVKYTESLMQ